MALCGDGAMVLYYDIVRDAVEDHDDWHTHEHFPERVGIPGFLRASRWVALGDGPRYLVVYEVENTGVLSDAPYLERLNNPTPWTAKMMPGFRGMTRGFCRVASSAGQGLGSAMTSVRLSPLPGRENELRDWLAGLLPGLASQRGVASAHLLEPAAQPPMTKEQAIRGKDADMPWVLLVTGYGEEAVAEVGREAFAESAVAAHGGAAGSIRGGYRLHGLLTRPELRQGS
jgi:hypothetical protein